MHDPIEMSQVTKEKGGYESFVQSGKQPWHITHVRIYTRKYTVRDTILTHTHTYNTYIYERYNTRFTSPASNRLRLSYTDSPD